MNTWINAMNNPPPINQPIVLYGVQYEFDKQPMLILGKLTEQGIYNSDYEGQIHRVFYWAPIPKLPSKGKKYGKR